MSCYVCFSIDTGLVNYLEKRMLSRCRPVAAYIPPVSKIADHAFTHYLCDACHFWPYVVLQLHLIRRFFSYIIFFKYHHKKL